MESQSETKPLRVVPGAGDTQRPRVGLARSLCAAVAIVAFTMAPATARAADALSIKPAVDRGVAQLEGVQLPDGGFGARLPVRDSATVAEALLLARPQSTAIPRVAQFLAARAVEDVDNLARAAVASRAPRFATALLAQQRVDGGFGLSLEYESDPLDTALALRALTALGERDAARRAADRLLRFSTAGVWGTGGGDVALTSEALLALDAYIRRYGSTTAIDGTLATAIGWVGGAQHAGGSWSPDTLAVRRTALATTALAPTPAAVARVSAGADALLAAQLPDGSWGDEFTTAQAIRALHAAGDAIERDRVTQLPDPSVSARDISANPQSVESGRAVTIKAVVSNAGSAAAAGVTAQFFLEDPASGAEPVASVEVPDVAPGGGVPIDATFAVTKPRGRARAHVVVRSPVGEDRDLANNANFIHLFVRTARNTYRRTRDWPRPGRDMQHSGATPNRLHPAVDPDPLWRAPADGAHIVAEGNVYFGEDGRITARDAKTGELAWQRGGSYQDDRYRPPLYNRGFIYTATEGQTGALNANTGDPSIGIGGWGGDRPVFGFEVIPVENGHDPAFLYLAGAPWMNAGWKYCHIQPYKDPSGLPSNEAWEGQSSILPPGWVGGVGNLHFNHPCDGEPLAFAGDDSRAFFVSGSWMSSFDPATGRGANGEPLMALFSRRVPLYRAPAAPLVDSLNQVVAAGWDGSGPAFPGQSSSDVGTQTGKGRIIAADPSTGSLYWSVTTDARLDGSPVEYKGTIIVVDRSGRVYGIDQVTGALKWSWTPDGYTPPAVDQQEKAGQTLALSGRYLYVPHPDGRLYTLDARNGSVLSSTMFGARPYDLAIDDTNNAIYVRTLDGHVGAYRTRVLPDQCAPDPANVPPAPGPIDRVSLGADGSQLVGPVAADQRPAISADGRVVAFTREYGAPTYSTDVVVRDLESGATTVIPAADQVSADVTRNNPRLPTLSNDGRYVGFIANQRNNRIGGADMMLVLDRETGVTEPVLKKPDGSPHYDIGLSGASTRASWWWESPGYSMSGDGKTFAFVTGTNNVVPGVTDTDTAPDVIVVNRVTGERRFASRKTLASTYNEGNHSPALSRDGRYLVFTSDESLTGAAVAPGSHDANRPYVHLYDVAADTLTPVKNPDTGLVVNGSAPHISGDGRFVTFTSMAPSLLPPTVREGDSWWWGFSVNAFVLDRATGGITFASPNDSGRHAGWAAISKAVVSDDGQYVSFESTGTFLKGITVARQAQIVGRDRAAGTTRQVSHNDWGVSGSGESLAPRMSADGRRVVFVSSAPDLVSGDTNNARDVFVYDRGRAATAEAPVDAPEPDLSTCPVAGEEAETYSDLSIAPGDIEPGALEQGQSARVDVTVRNDGGAPSDATTVRLYDGTAARGTLIGEHLLSELASGASTKLSFTWNPVDAAGARTFTVVADPDRLVFEQDVADNEAQKAVHVTAPRLDVSVEADRLAYGADQPVEVTARLANSSVAERDLRLVMSIRDPDGDAVASVHDGQVRIEPNATAAADGHWNTRDTTPGRYTVSTRLLNPLGDELAVGVTSFEIQPDVAAGLALDTDQLVYGPRETAKIGVLVSNRSANFSLPGAHVELSLIGADRTPLDRWELPAGEVIQGGAALLNQDKPLQDLDPGDYRLSAKLLAASGSPLAEATAEFAVASSADTGDGVRGSLTAEPSDPYRLSTATFSYSLGNSGNADVPGATVRVRISDLTSGQTLKTLDEARTITRDAVTAGSLSTTADMAENRDYQASLHLKLADGSERPLARTIIHVRPAPFTYGASFDTTPRNRVLVWACSRADEAAARTALGDTFASFVPDRSESRYDRDTGCGRYAEEEQRRFMRLVRSGDYNQLWILGRHHPLERSVGDELAVRVIQGDGLLIAGGSPGFDLNQGGNLSPIGAAYAGTLPPGTHTLQFAPASVLAGLDAEVTEPPARVTTTQATGIATTSWGPADSRKTAIAAAYNQFGRGKTIYVGSAPSAFLEPARAAAVLREAARVLLPSAGATRAPGLARLELFVEGAAPGTPLEVRTQLAPGMSVAQPPADATSAGDLLTLPFDTNGTQRRQRSVWLKLPVNAASATTSSTIHYRDAADGETKVYGDPAIAMVDIAETKATARDAALAALGAVGTASPAEQAKVEKIKDDIAATALETGDAASLWARIRVLVDDIGTLERASWSNTAPARVAVARLVAYVECDYYRVGGE